MSEPNWSRSCHPVVRGGCSPTVWRGSRATGRLCPRRLRRAGGRSCEARGRARRGRVIADGPIRATALARLARARPVIYNAHNLESGFRHDLGGRGSEPASAPSSAGCSNARPNRGWSARPISPARAVPDAHLRYVPNVAVDVAAIEPVSSPAAERAGRCFHGQLRLRAPDPNGLHFLLERVSAGVAKLPDARLDVVGGAASRPPLIRA